MSAKLVTKELSKQWKALSDKEKKEYTEGKPKKSKVTITDVTNDDSDEEELTELDSDSD